MYAALSTATMDNTEDNPRVQIYKLVKNIFEFDKQGSNLALQIERGCYERACELLHTEGSFANPQFRQAYSDICYRVTHALVKCAELQADVIDGTHQPARLAWLTAEELMPQVNAKMRELITLRSQQRVQIHVSHAYVCQKCGKRNTDGGVEQQRRAADEGSTLTIKCLEPFCGNMWRVG